uniref:Secreted protein n=1 Tax=Anguilla anguilla TaxID=7936 RepID=A0A0E9S2X0_ANGAN
MAIIVCSAYLMQSLITMHQATLALCLLSSYSPLDIPGKVEFQVNIACIMTLCSFVRYQNIQNPLKWTFLSNIRY